MAEVVLSLYGLDNLADYSEYVFERHHEAIAAHPPMELVWLDGEQV